MLLMSKQSKERLEKAQESYYRSSLQLSEIIAATCHIDQKALHSCLIEDKQKRGPVQELLGRKIKHLYMGLNSPQSIDIFDQYQAANSLYLGKELPSTQKYEDILLVRRDPKTRVKITPISRLQAAALEKNKTPQPIRPVIEKPESRAELRIARMTATTATQWNKARTMMNSPLRGAALRKSSVEDRVERKKLFYLLTGQQKQKSMKNFVQIQRAQAFSKVIEIVRAHLKAPVLEGRRQSKALIDQFEPFPTIDLRKFRSLSKRQPPILSLLGTWTKELIEILEVGEDACQAFIDRFAKLSLMADSNVNDVAHNLTLIFKAFGRTLHYLLKGVRRTSNFQTLGMTPLTDLEEQDSLFYSTMRSQSIPAEVPYKIKFRFKQLLLNVDIKGLLITLINCEEQLEQHFYFYHILSTMLLEESSIQEVQGSLKPQFVVENGTKVFKPINLHLFQSFVIEAKTLLLEELPKEEFWYDRVLKPLRESIFVGATSIVSPLQSQNYIVNQEIQRILEVEISMNREEKLRQKIISKLRDMINTTGVGVTDLAVEVYGEVVCAQHIVLNARFLRYLEPSQVVTKIVLVLLPLLMHLIKVREEWQGGFKLITSQKGSIDIDKTKQFYSLGMRGAAGDWWIKKTFEYPRIHLTRRPEVATEFTMSDYVAMIDSGDLNIPKKGFRELNKVENFRGTTAILLTAEAEHTHNFRLERLLEKEKAQIKKI